MRTIHQHQSVQAALQSKIGHSKTTKGWNRKTIQDLCDFCLKTIFVSRNALPFRKSGYKFGCFKCHKEGKFKWKKEGGIDKIMPEIVLATKPRL